MNKEDVLRILELNFDWYIDYDEMVKFIDNQDKEIEKLNNIINKAIEHIDKELCNINVQENIMLKNELLKIKNILQGIDKE